MKILIYSTGRSGSGNLCTFLSNELGYTKIDEPFNKKLWRNSKYNLKDLEQDNIVCKCLIDEWEYEGSGIKNVDELISLFDKIIILTREDVTLQAESLFVAFNNKRWSTKYNVSESFILKNKNKIDEYKNLLLNQNLKLNKLTGLKVTYEGIYFRKDDIDKIKEYIELKEIKDLSILHVKNKFRINNKKTKLL
jgi:hypothetical protein